MLKKIIIITLCIVSLFSISGKESPQTISIVNLKLDSISEAKVKDELSGYIFEYLYLNEKYSVIEQDIVDSVTHADLRDLFSISQELNSELLVLGEIRKFTKSYVLTFKLYSKSKDKIVSEEKFTFNPREKLDVNEKKDNSEDKVEVKKSDKQYVTDIYDALDNVLRMLLKDYEKQNFVENQKRIGGSIEGSYAVINMVLVDEESDWDYNEIYHVVKAGYTYQFNDMFSFGGSFGAIISIDNKVISNPINPMLGVNFVIGNKVDGFAGVVGLEIAANVPSDVFIGGKKTIPLGYLGLYYKNIFVKGVYLDILYSKVGYIEMGYSYYIGK